MVFTARSPLADFGAINPPTVPWIKALLTWAEAVEMRTPLDYYPAPDSTTGPGR
jgi:hypothetical protein